MTDQQAWYAIYIVMDLIGVVTFGGLFMFIMPKKWWRGNRWTFRIALIQLSLTIFFSWLLLADVGTLFEIPVLQLIGTFPTRGLVLRSLLLSPGTYFIYEIFRPS